MKRCKRNVLLIFGYILLMAILFVPYESEKGKNVTGKTVKIIEKNGYVFLPVFIMNKSKYVSIKEKYAGWSEEKQLEEIRLGNVWRRYRLNKELYTTQLGIFFLFGGFVYILFCVVLRKEKREVKQKPEKD